MSEAPKTSDAAAQAAAEAVRTDAFETAASSFRGLVVAETHRLAWRLRHADALEALGREADADAERNTLAESALEGGAPVAGLVAALSADRSELDTFFAHYLAGSKRLEVALTPARPPLPAQPSPMPAFDADAALPKWPSRLRAEGELLPRLPLLSDLSVEAFGALAPSLSRTSLLPGEAFLFEGAPARAVYLLADGVVEIFKTDARRGEILLGRLGEGALVGEIALTQDGPRSAGARAVGFVEALRIEVDGVKAAAAQVPAVAAALNRFTEQRLLSNLLRTSPVLGRLSESARNALARGFVRVPLVEGELLVEQGDARGALCVVGEGVVNIERDGAEVARLSSGEVFGEMALVSGEATTATAVVSAPGWMLQLEPTAFESICEAHGEIIDCMNDLRSARVADNRFIFDDEAFFEPAD